MKAVRVLPLLAISLLPHGAAGDGYAAEPRPRMSYLDNGLIKVGVDLKRGGSIGYLADVRQGRNVVNIHDLGRWIGQSYYAGPTPFGTPHSAWQNWPWNPVSAGDVYGNPSQLIEVANDGKTLYVKSVPRQWALKNVPGDCQFETWVTLEHRTVHVRNRLTNQRQDVTQYPAMDQELPAVYTVGKLHRLMAYSGEKPFTNQPIAEIPKQPAQDGKPRWTPFFGTEHWAALVDDNHWGLGVIHPGVVRFLGGSYGQPGTGGPADDSCGYVAPVRREILDHNIVYEYRYSLVLDSLANIRREAYRQRPASPCPAYRFQRDRQHWRYVNAADTGFPIKDRLQLRVDQADPQMIGPEGCWNAADVPTIYIRAAYRTTDTTAELFWETTDKPGFQPDQSIRFAVIPDGKLRTYEVRLADSPTYRGTIRRLRFDPVASGRPGETVDVEFISASKD